MEFVFVIPRDALFPDCYPQGLLAVDEGFDPERFLAVAARSGFFVERDVAERTPAWKQVIPYSIVVRGEELLLLKRTRRGRETRLHDKLSIGVGGHVEPIDLRAGPNGLPAPGRNPFPGATARELAEELLLEDSGEARLVGLLNDDSDPVGAVHVGLVQVLAVRGTVEVREKDQLEGRMTTPRELREMLGRGAAFESWTKLLIPHLENVIPEPVAS